MFSVLTSDVGLQAIDSECASKCSMHSTGNGTIVTPPPITKPQPKKIPD